MKFRIRFKLYGKGMQTVIEADSKFDAMKILRNKIEIIDVVPEDNNKDIDFFNQIFNKI